MQFGAWLQLLIFPPFMFIKRNANVENVINAMKYGIIFISGVFLFHILFPSFFLFKFNYFMSFKIAQNFLNNDNVGMKYTTWWWLSFIHLLQFAGSGVTAGLILRYWNALNGKIKIDGYSFICLASLLIYLFGNIIRGNHMAWKFMFLIVLIIPVATLALFTKNGKNLILNKKYFVLLLILMYFETIFYQFFIWDAQ